MRGISEVLLRTMQSEIKESLNINSTISDYHYGKLSALSDAICECRELQEPWIPLDEFLKSGFEGKCWVLKIDQEVQFTECYESITEQKVFSGNTGSIPHSRIIKVFPIHKPEPPR